MRCRIQSQSDNTKPAEYCWYPWMIHAAEGLIDFISFFYCRQFHNASGVPIQIVLVKVSLVN